MPNLVDGNSFWLPQLALFIKCVLLEEETDVVRTLVEVVIRGLCLQHMCYVGEAIAVR